MDAHLPGFIVDQIHIGSWFVDPADEEIGHKFIIIIIVLKVGFGKKIRTEGIDDPGCSDIGGEFPFRDREIKTIPVIDALQIQMFIQFQAGCRAHPKKTAVIELADAGFGSDGNLFTAV